MFTCCSRLAVVHNKSPNYDGAVNLHVHHTPALDHMSDASNPCWTTLGEPPVPRNQCVTGSAQGQGARSALAGGKPTHRVLQL